MQRQELTDRTGSIHNVFSEALGATSFKGVIPGTGWKQGLGGIFHEEGRILYSDLAGLPASDGAVPGHSKAVRYGTVEGNPVLDIGRIHDNESRNPEIAMAMRMILEALKDNLHGLIVTNGVGTLHGPIEDPRGKLMGMLRTWGIDAQAWLIRSRAKEEIGIGQVCVVDSFDTRYLGPASPLVAGEFVDPCHHGYQRDNGHYLRLAQTQVRAIQGSAPLGRYGFIFGPQFEDPEVKLTMRKDGDDIVGMSGKEGIMATQMGLPFMHLALTTNGAFAPHSHAGNEAMGEERSGMLGDILKGLIKSEWTPSSL